jgi:hypothetical protein
MKNASKSPRRRVITTRPAQSFVCITYKTSSMCGPSATKTARRSWHSRCTSAHRCSGARSISQIGMPPVPNGYRRNKSEPPSRKSRRRGQVYGASVQREASNGWDPHQRRLSRLVGRAPVWRRLRPRRLAKIPHQQSPTQADAPATERSSVNSGRSDQRRPAARRPPCAPCRRRDRLPRCEV